MTTFNATLAAAPPLARLALLACVLPAPAPAAGDLETVIVRAAREPVALSNLGSATTLLDAETLQQRQLAPLGEILRAVPGIAVSRVGVMGSQTQIRMRGSEANQVLVLIDGVRANDPAQNDEFNIAHVLNHGVESVEVIRGPQSALWGSDALAGVISIRTRAATERRQASVFAETGSNRWQNLGATAALGSDRVRLRGAINTLETDGENISRQGGESDGYENVTANLVIDADATETLRLSASLRFSDAANDFDGTDFATGLPADRDNRSEVQRTYGRVSAEFDSLDARWVHRLSYAHTNTDNRNRSQNDFAPGGFDETRADGEIRLLGYQSSFYLTDDQRFTAAVERQEQAFRQRGPVSFFGDPNRDERIVINSWIAEYSLGLTDTVSLLLSGRHDRNSDFKDTTTGRLSAAWRVGGSTSGTKLRASWGTGVKNPTFTERFGFFTNFVGNPDLRPEESEGWDLGLDQTLLDGRLAFSMTWFEADLQDEINGFVFDPGAGAFTAANEDGESQRRGAEISGDWQISADLQLSLGYTWLDASDSDGSREIRRPRHVASGNLNWRLLAGRANLNLNVDYNGVQDDTFFPPVPPFQQRVELAAFTLVTIAGSYRLGPRLELFARVENALDEEYEEVFGFATMGRTGYAGVRFRFAD